LELEMSFLFGERIRSAKQKRVCWLLLLVRRRRREEKSPFAAAAPVAPLPVPAAAARQFLNRRG
jgi:hypothetical protein